MRCFTIPGDGPLSMFVGAVAETAYEAVRSDGDPADWAVFGFDGDNRIKLAEKGTGALSSILSRFKANERAFAYIRFKVGDDISARSKFVYIAWVGDEVTPLKRARMSTDKAFLKSVIQEFSLEVFANTVEDIDEQVILDKLIKASGANYGSSSS